MADQTSVGLRLSTDGAISSKPYANNVTSPPRIADPRGCSPFATVAVHPGVLMAGFHGRIFALPRNKNSEKMCFFWKHECFLSGIIVKLLFENRAPSTVIWLTLGTDVPECLGHVPCHLSTQGWSLTAEKRSSSKVRCTWHNVCCRASEPELETRRGRPCPEAWRTFIQRRK